MTDKAQKQLGKFLAYTFLITWSAWGLLAWLINSGLTQQSTLIGRLLFFIGGFGPTFAAVLVMPPKKRQAKALLQYMKQSKPGSWKFLLIFMPLTFLAFYLPTRTLNPEMPLFFFPALVAMMALVGGGNEELGWRGFMQPLLEQRLGFIAATIVTASVWGIWHLPLWWIPGDPHQAMAFLPFFGLGFGLSFLLGSLYKASQSVLYTMIYHGFLNATLSLVQTDYNWMFVLGMLVLSLGAIALWYYVDRRDPLQQ